MMDKKKALGRGLETLLPAARGVAPVAGTAPAPGERVHELALEEIERNPYQTRSYIDKAALEELAESIRANGVVQPIVVRPLAGGKYQLIAGERRWQASKLAGKQAIPAIVKQVSNEQALEMTIIENLQREDLNAMEQARAYERLGREFGLTQEQMAGRTGKPRSAVANYLRLLKMPEEVQMGIENGQLSFGHAKVLMTLDSDVLVLHTATRVVKEALSVRQTEDLVAMLLAPEEPKRAAAERRVDPNVRAAEEKLQETLGLKVEIHDHRGKGSIVIRYNSLEDFDRLFSVLNQDPPDPIGETIGRGKK